MDILVGVLCIAGALCFLLSAASMLRVKDAISRVNVLSISTGVGMPLLIIAAMLDTFSQRGFHWFSLVEAVLAIVATLVGTSIASVTLARAIYRSSSPLDPRTAYDDLAK